MQNILLFNSNKPNIGLKVRGSVEGPELTLLNNFLGQKLNKYKRKSEIAVFIEPEIKSGFPDAVFAKYDYSKIQYWNDARCNLTESDIKILYYMMLVKKVSSEQLIRNLGVSKGKLIGTFENLLDAELIMRKSSAWIITEDIKQKIMIEKLTAIEAKINNWKKVFEQAQYNFSFANESYVLTPTKNPTEKIKNHAKEIGVGIYSYANDNVYEIIKPHKNHGVMGYTSLMFNEWLGRTLYKGQ